MLGDVERGSLPLNQAEETFRIAGDHNGLAHTLVRRAAAHRISGNYQASLVDSDEALSLTEGQDKPDLVHAKAIRSKGLSLYWMGALDAAIEHLEKSLNVFLALNDEENTALLLTELGMAYRNAGTAMGGHCPTMSAPWPTGRKSKTWSGKPHFSTIWGYSITVKGDYDQASAHLEEALERARQSGYTRMEALALTGIGDLYVDLDALDAALDAYHQAEEIAQRTEDCFLLLYLHLAEIGLAVSKGELQQAHERLETAEKLVRRSNSLHQQGMWELAAGRLTLAEGEAEDALGHLDTAARCFEDGGQRVENAQSHVYLADVYHTVGDREEALSHLAHAFNSAPSPNGQHALVVAGRHTKSVLEAAKSDGALGTQALRLLQQIAEFEKKILLLRRRLRRRVSTVPIDPPKLIIQAMGTMRVELGGKPVTEPAWRSRRLVRELFFLFLAHPGGLSKEAIGGILWPDGSPAQIKLRFKNAIFRLRRALGQEVILFQDNLYRFNQALDYEYDVEVFLRKIARGDAATDPTKKAAAYQEAVHLYKGSYLPEAEGTWVWAERERLCQEFLRATLMLAEHYIAFAEHENALDYCQCTLTEDSCLEAAHRLAMRAYAAMGNRAGVKRQFECCRLALKEEINAAPSRQTENLYQTLIH